MNKKDLPQTQDILFIIIFTDLDGTLLDHETYQWEAAKPALALCKKHGFPVVLVSSKTRAEMERLRDQMAISDPFIAENGGGIYFPTTAGTSSTENRYTSTYEQVSLGLPYTQLIKALHEIRKELGLTLRGFSDMDVSELCNLTGLDPESIKLAKIREYDEPFIIFKEGPLDKEAVVQAATQRGLSVTEGGRFYHLQGGNDKGKAMEMVISRYKQSHKQVISVALGDSPNDFPMLVRADYPVLIRSQQDYSHLKHEIPRLRTTRLKGPSGWNAAVLELLHTRLAVPAS